MITTEKQTVYVVAYVNFDGRDDNLYFDVNVFADETEARQKYLSECDTALNDAMYEDGCSDDDELYAVEGEHYDNEYDVRRVHSDYYTQVKLIKKEI